MTQPVRLFVLALFLLALGGCAAVQQNLMFEGEGPRGTLTMPHTTIFMPTPGGGRIEVGRFGEADAPHAVVYFPGIREDPLVAANNIRRLLQTPAVVYTLYYRGDGRSRGAAGEGGLLVDAMNLMELVARRHDTITVVGYSIGSTLASAAAGYMNGKVAKLVLVAPADAISAVSADSSGLPEGFLRLGMAYPLAAVEFIRPYHGPVEVIRFHDDEIIRPERSAALMAILRPGQLVGETVLPGGHKVPRNWKTNRAYREALKNAL